jgi:5-oxoprolinase (ATP-hydrolysing) subunit A
VSQAWSGVGGLGAGTAGRSLGGPLGDGAWVLDLPAGVTPAKALRALCRVPGVRDVVIAERLACLYFDPLAPPDVEDAVARLGVEGEPEPASSAVTIAVRYDGPDLPRVAALSGLTVEEVVGLHLGREYVVELVGFLPGFAYLGKLDPRLVAPRLDAPRPRVSAGAVGLAGDRTGVYPFASPGGWNLIGTAVGFRPFDPIRGGAALALGARVRFGRVG